MTIDELKAAAKLRTRKMSTDELDEDIFRYVDFALADLKRIGVAEEYLKAPEDPLIIEAVLTYVKANYSMDANHERLMNSYNMILTKIKGGGTDRRSNNIDRSGRNPRRRRESEGFRNGEPDRPRRIRGSR